MANQRKKKLYSLQTDDNINAGIYCIDLFTECTDVSSSFPWELAGHKVTVEEKSGCSGITLLRTALSVSLSLSLAKLFIRHDSQLERSYRDGPRPTQPLATTRIYSLKLQP